MEDGQETEHLGNELLGEEADFVEIEPSKPATDTAVSTGQSQILPTKRKEGIYCFQHAFGFTGPDCMDVIS